MAKKQKWDFFIADYAERPHCGVSRDGETFLCAALSQQEQVIEIVARLNAADRGTPFDTDFASRMKNVLERTYHQLATDSDLEAVQCPAKYLTLTNMMAAILDEMGSSQISAARRTAYQQEAAISGWGGFITPRPATAPLRSEIDSTLH